MEYTHHYDSPLGGIVMTSDGDALTGLWFDGQKHSAVPLTSGHDKKALTVFDLADRWLDIYFDGKDPGFIPPLHTNASSFRTAVWEILLTIPYGQTMTYGQVAAIAAGRLGLSRMSAQAAGGAVGHNPIWLIIPCHRVVGSDGSLTGYAGGIWRKLRLLSLEGVDTSKLRLPRQGKVF